MTLKGRAEMSADITHIRSRAEAARDIEAEVSDLESRLADRKAKLSTLYYSELPSLFADASIDHLGLPARGNLPAIDLELKPYFNANIAAKWDEEKKREGYDYLVSINAGDLIKVVLSISFPREKRDDALHLASQLTDDGYIVQVGETVNHQTLTAWLKDQVINEGVVPDLEKIGGKIGQVVKPKERTQP